MITEHQSDALHQMDTQRWYDLAYLHSYDYGYGDVAAIIAILHAWSTISFHMYISYP